VRWPTISRLRPRSTGGTAALPPAPERAVEEPDAELLPVVEPEAPPPELAPNVADRGTAEQGRRRIGRSAGARQERAPVRWNIWALERVAREHPESEELPFLVLSLREFADSAGQLPAEFDPLVRESFGDLLAG
jgi:hypothetical protein